VVREGAENPGARVEAGEMVEDGEGENPI